MRTTIVVFPRERFSSLPHSLVSLFATIEYEQPVIVVEGATPLDLRRELHQISKRRPFEHVSLPYPITPNQARNIGLERATTEYVVFSDNDIDYEPGWLDALEHTAVADQADAVAPLIFIGPANPPRVHHAGGVLIEKHNESGRNTVSEKHRLMNARWHDVADEIDELAPASNEVCEFHCALVRRKFLRDVGGLDERLITREQIDFALQLKARQGKVRFSSKSWVTYRAFDPIKRLDDLHYFLFRWSDTKVVASLDAFEENWDFATERERVRWGWTRMHRCRAVQRYYARLSKILGHRLTKRVLLPFEEWRASLRFKKAFSKASHSSASQKRDFSSEERASPQNEFVKR